MIKSYIILILTFMVSSCDSQNTQIKIKPFTQTDDSRCGPATLKMVLGYYGYDVSEDSLAIKCKHNYNQGCTNSDIERVLRGYGLRTYSKTYGTISDLKYWVDKNVPVIVDWFTTGVNPTDEDGPDGHASIVVGVTDTHVQLLDPEHGKVRNMKHNDFMRVWFDWEGSNHMEDNTKMNIRYMLVAW